VVWCAISETAVFCVNISISPALPLARQWVYDSRGHQPLRSLLFTVQQLFFIVTLTLTQTLTQNYAIATF